MISSTLVSQSVATPAPPTFAQAIQLQNPQNPLLFLQRRQNSCPVGYAGCTTLNMPSICCLSDAICTPDAANHIACCPSGALCTGTVGGTATASEAGAVVIASGNTASDSSFNGQTTAAATTTSYNVFPSTIVAAEPASTVTNPYFPFLYIPTTFADAAVCSSYYTSCGSEYASCTSSLAGGNHVNGVTVTGIGGGITVQGATATAVTQAQSICSSLSAQGCYGLQLSNCAAFGRAGTGIVGAANGTGKQKTSKRRDTLGVALIVGLALNWL